MFNMNRHLVAKTAAVLAMAAVPFAGVGIASAEVVGGNGERVCEVSINGETQSGTGDECDALLASVPSFGPFEIPDFGSYEAPDFGSYEAPDFGSSMQSSSSASSSASASASSSDGERVCQVSINGETQSGTGDECDDLIGSLPDLGSHIPAFGPFGPFGPLG